MAAQFVTPEAINFMATHGRGLICVTLNEEQVDRLKLPMMQPPGRSGPAARHGVHREHRGPPRRDHGHQRRRSRAHDPRRRQPGGQARGLVTPGHVFPLRARKGGVLVRTGQTEGSVDLARLADLTPAGVICEIMNEDGTMARMPDLERFAQKHGLRILTIADLIQYRLYTERLVRARLGGHVALDQTGTEWRAIVYEIDDRRPAVPRAREGRRSRAASPPLCRVHTGSTVADLFASTPRDGGRHLREAIAADRGGRARGARLHRPARRRARASSSACAQLSDRRRADAPPEATRRCASSVSARRCSSTSGCTRSAF